MSKIEAAARDILSLEDKAIDAYLHIGAKKYEIQSFETEFSQAIDYKGQPQHEVKGGLLSFTLKQAADEVLNRWMFQNDVFHDGVVVFAPVSRISNPPLTVAFTRGRCISYEKMIGVDIGIRISLLISAELIDINGIEHRNSTK